MRKNFTKKDIGAAVVFKGFDGGSYSGTIANVTSDYVTVRYFPVSSQPVLALVVRSEWGRLVRFGSANFLTLA